MGVLSPGSQFKIKEYSPSASWKICFGCFLNRPLVSEIFIKHHTILLSNEALSHLYVLPHLHTRQGYHYSSSHLQHQARSIIFLENHYGCVYPWGRSYAGENRSREMTVSSDLITSVAKPDSVKGFRVLSVSVFQIHYGTKIAIMNSWLLNILNFHFGKLSVKSGCNLCLCTKWSPSACIQY